jgi:hypothetical protein
MVIGIRIKLMRGGKRKRGKSGACIIDTENRQSRINGLDQSQRAHSFLMT